MTDAQILEALTIPGLNIEASLETRELPLLLDGIRAIVESIAYRAPPGCVVIEEADMVPHVHPQYGSGLFVTEDCVNKMNVGARDDHYSDAFYEIAKALGIGARSDSPKAVFENDVLPMIKQLVSGKPTIEMVLHCPKCGECDRTFKGGEQSPDAIDAQRYRYLRTGEGEIFAVYGSSRTWGECGHMNIYDDHLDAEIDKAIAASEPKGDGND